MKPEDALGFALSDNGFYFPGNGVQLNEAKYVFFGVPFDSGSSGAPGSRFGPKAAREVVQDMELWSQFFGLDLEQMLVYDAGDVPVSHGDFPASSKAVTEAVERIRRLGKTPLMIGGEHTFTPFAAAAAGADSLIVFDAHADCRKDYLGNPFSHACATRIWVERGGRTLQVGVRATSRDEREFCSRFGVIQVDQFQLEKPEYEQKIRDFALSARGLYISVDLDVFDPAFAPGVGTPEPLGISPLEVVKLFGNISAANVVGFDVMELCPPRDPSYSTAALAAKLFMEFYASRESQRRQG